MRRTFACLALAGCLLALVAGCGKPSLGPRETAEAFLRAMEARDFVAAYNLLSADSQATVTAEEFKAMLEKAWSDAGIAGFRVESVQAEVLSATGTRASVPYSATLTKTSGESAVVYNALSLVRQDEQWRVIWPPVR